MQVNQSAQPEAELKAALDNFETSIATPIVAGDSATWIEDVERSWAEAAAQVHYHVKHLHPRQFEEIAAQDPELLPRVDVLQAEDAAIEDQRGKLSQSVTRLAQHVPRMQPDEEKALKYTKPFVDEATAFVARVPSRLWVCRRGTWKPSIVTAGPWIRLFSQLEVTGNRRLSGAARPRL